MAKQQPNSASPMYETGMNMPMNQGNLGNMMQTTGLGTPENNFISGGTKANANFSQPAMPSYGGRNPMMDDGFGDSRSLTVPFPTNPFPDLGGGMGGGFPSVGSPSPVYTPPTPSGGSGMFGNNGSLGGNTGMPALDPVNGLDPLGNLNNDPFNSINGQNGQTPSAPVAPNDPTISNPSTGGGQPATPPAYTPPPMQPYVAPPSMDTTYDNIMGDFNATSDYQQTDYSGNNQQLSTQGRGMSANAGSFLPELDYIPEATNNQTARNVGQGLNDVSLAQDGRQSAEDSLYGQATSRLDPRFEQEQEQLQIDLRNRGLSEGDAAYDAAMENFNMGKNDAYNQAKFSSINQAGAESERDFGMESERRAQMFGEQMGMSQDEISRLQQDMSRQELIQRRAGADQELSLADQELMLRGDAQMFDQEMTQAEYINRLRSNQIGEENTRRNQTLNELNALLSGAQVAQPDFNGFSQAGNAGGVDYTGAARDAYSGSVDRSNIRNGALNNAINGAGSIAGMFSDERLKDNIRKVGETNGFNIYTWTWNNLMPEVFKRGMKGVGVIAQEVERIMPDAIIQDNSGFMKVDYSKVLGE